ncbi:MAG: M48 family metallopeptidase [Sedimentitalea sp.]
MSQHNLPGDPSVELILRRSGRARRISLRISQLDGRVTLTLPTGVPEREALDFAASKSDWIRGHLAARGTDTLVDFGSQVPVAGVLREIVPGSGRRVTLAGNTICVPGTSAGPKVQAFLRNLAREKLAGASDHYAAALGLPYARLTLRDTRSRWGSCTSQGGLMYSWRLVMADPSVLNYVAAHEVAHLREMNHSAAFWAVVERLYGSYKAPRSWLRTHGASLHHYRFD